MAAPPETEPSQERQTRDTRRRGRISHYPQHVDRWAIIVGISEYQHDDWNLDYAHCDAKALYELIQEPSHGDFPTENILCLINKDATTRDIQKALRSFLQKPKKEDPSAARR